AFECRAGWPNKLLQRSAGNIIDSNSVRICSFDSSASDISVRASRFLSWWKSLFALTLWEGRARQLRIALNAMLQAEVVQRRLLLLSLANRSDHCCLCFIRMNNFATPHESPNN